MTSFAYRILPPRAEFWNTLAPGDAAIMVRYLVHLRRLRTDGRVRFVGRSKGVHGPESAPGINNYGFVLVEAEDEAHANAIAHSDPAVSEGLVRLERHPFMVVLDSPGDTSPVG